MIRVAVTGGRNITESYFVASRLSALHVALQFKELVHGGAKSGVDLFAHHWCRQASVAEFIEEITGADWAALGKMAGSVRNRRMLIRYRPEALIAFPGGTGTFDCMKQAEELGIEIIKVGR